MAKPLPIKGGVMGHSKLRAAGELLQQQQTLLPRLRRLRRYRADAIERLSRVVFDRQQE